MPLTMPEELLLLMLDDDTGRLIDRAMPSGDYALIGAVLAELALAGRIDSDPQRMFVVDKSPMGDAVLDAVLLRMAASAEDHDSRWWIEHLAVGATVLREELFARLVAHGVLQQVDSKFLWVFPERRYPPTSGREEREVKARLLGVIFNDEIPEPRDTMLIGLARATGLLALILSPAELERAQPRIDQVANLEELNRSLSAAVQEILAQVARYGYLS
ncbi:MAG: GPP34 family phosphoprotein [Acetobacteraceae bacterium]|nr:MAG: GPP34 family phosphoprotein [Acetobacteraceae bacterium]